jgi:hypothetical protein
MLSGAELATIVLARAKSIPEKSRIGSHLKFLDDRGAVYALGRMKSRPKWTDWCSRCLQPGHLAHACKASPICTTCQQPHMTRHCPRVGETTTSQCAEDPVTADDGIHRDASMASGVERGKASERPFARRAVLPASLLPYQCER